MMKNRMKLRNSGSKVASREAEDPPPSSPGVSSSSSPPSSAMRLSSQMRTAWNDT